MYKKLSEILGDTKTDRTNCILKIKDEFGNTLTNSLYIPFNEANTDYQEYLAWVAEGNTPEEAD